MSPPPRGAVNQKCPPLWYNIRRGSESRPFGHTAPVALSGAGAFLSPGSATKKIKIFSRFAIDTLRRNMIYYGQTMREGKGRGNGHP